MFHPYWITSFNYDTLEISAFAYEAQFLWRATTWFQMSLAVWKYFQFFWTELSPYVLIACYINFCYSIYQILV